MKSFRLPGSYLFQKKLQELEDEELQKAIKLCLEEEKSKEQPSPIVQMNPTLPKEQAQPSHSQKRQNLQKKNQKK